MATPVTAAELLAGKILPYFILAITSMTLCVLVVREILHPEQDAVRRNYADDPDGGLLDGTPDAPWLDRFRNRRPAPTPTPVPTA